MFYTKRIAHDSDELHYINMVDAIDPEDKWHIGHPNVENNDKILLLKFVHGGKELSSLKSESSDIILNVVKGISNIISGLISMHENGIYHRDIKTSNILYDESCTVRLIDFGISIRSDDIYNDTIYDNIYYIWPFETKLISYGRGNIEKIFSDSQYEEYVKSKYFKPIIYIHDIDVSEIKYNIITLIRKFSNEQELFTNISSRIDTYSLGVTLSYLLYDIKDVLDPVQYDRMLRLTKKMVNPYTLQRISLKEALDEYKLIWNI